jgi:type I restriction enzyme S subunit
MGCEWPFVKLGDHCTKIGSGATPKGGKESYLDEGPYSLVRSQNIHNDGFHYSGLAYISDEQAKKLDGVAVEAGDVLLNITGDSVARVCSAPASVLPARVNQHVAIIRPDIKVFDPYFVRYYLTAPYHQELMLGLSSAGATRNAMTKGMIESFHVPCPPLSEQRSIASILSSLDDRIALLRETNTTLEAIAQAIFKSWFVDFDPVKAKAEGREPEGMDAETATLFPNEFEDSELGMIPKGWGVVPFGELLGHTIGGDWGKDVPEADHSECVSVVRGTDMPDIKLGSIDGVPSRFVTSKKLQSRRIVDGDITIEVSGGSKTQSTGRSYYFTDKILQKFDTPVVPASFCRLFRPTDKRIGLMLAIQLSKIYADGKMWSYQVQSTGLANFQTTHFLSSELVVVPPDTISAEFYNIARPLIERQQTGEIRHLASLRDTLLPRLMSGQLRVPDAEQQIAEML